MLLVIALAAQGCFFFCTLLLSARSTIRRRSIGSGALLFYGLSIVGVFLFCVVIPGVLISFGANKHVVLHSFPESIVGMPILLGGWVLGLVFAALVRAGQALIDMTNKTENSEDGDEVT